MDRRTIIVAGLVTLGTSGLARAQSAPIGQAPLGDLPPPPPQTPPPAEAPPAPNTTPSYAPGESQTYGRDEIVNNVSDFLGVTAEAAGGMVERLFAENVRHQHFANGFQLQAGHGRMPGNFRQNPIDVLHHLPLFEQICLLNTHGFAHELEKVHDLER